MKKIILTLVLLFSLSIKGFAVQWFDGSVTVRYNVVGGLAPVARIALDMFEEDMEMVTGKRAYQHEVSKIDIYELDKLTRYQLEMLKRTKLVTERLLTEQDSYLVTVYRGHIYIIGNNGRGTAYGILELSRQAGVSPWVWWSDVTPERKEELYMMSDFNKFESPSVKYRGIFINDEDWSTRVWAHKTVEPESPKGTIGPKTYRRIFELMLRLRANTLWPGMHEGTKAFFAVPGNRELADSFDIVVGSSHCEPLLRNNVAEWDKDTRGAYNFITNRKSVEKYWTERLKEVKGQDVLFTIGMRGIHDGAMEGCKTKEEKLNGLQAAIDCQRGLIKKFYDKNVTSVPQVFIPYKEVLDIYESGLVVPEDVTLMWCDDNYGYITRLSDEAQQQRPGGGGVYYHLSYWGRPHDYLWLTSTQPGLVYSEMKAAYDHNCKDVWIVNVHDPKVAAYDLSLFMDMAWNINSVGPTNLNDHLKGWLRQQLGVATAFKAAPIMQKFYQLCGMRRPEFMGWTQTELDKKKYVRGNSLPAGTEFSETEFGGELERYLEEYDNLVERVKEIGRDDATFFSIVQYPVECAAAMAHKHLDAQLGDTVSAVYYQERIKELTRQYNAMSNGKWDGLMDYKPRSLPVFDDFTTTDSTTLRRGKSRPLSEVGLDGCVVRNAATYDASEGTVQPIEMLGHSMNAVSIAKGGSLTYRFTATKDGKAVIRTALIPTQASDKGDIRYSVSLDGGEPAVYSLKEPFRSERWKQNVLRGQALRITDVDITAGEHTLTITALDDHIVFDQWMLDYKKDRQFYLFPVVQTLTGSPYKRK